MRKCVRGVVLVGLNSTARVTHEIDLVQEQDDGRPHEPPGVADGVEQGQRFLHTVLRREEVPDHVSQKPCVAV